MKTLIDCLKSTISYDDQTAIYAEKINGAFHPESPARFGQRQFKNGGIFDGCEFFAVNSSVVEFINSWTEGDAEADLEAGEILIKEENFSRVPSI